MTADPFFAATTLDDLLSKIEAHRTQHEELAKNLGRSALAVKNAVETIAESFSGSWFGWHAEMYYGNFEKPPMGKLFSVEWGAYHGLAPQWQGRTKADVDKRIEDLSQHLLIELSKQQWVLAREMKEGQDAFLSPLAPLANMNGLANEKELLKKLDNYRWDESPNDEFLVASREAAPHTTRDSQAAMQGLKTPAHIECAALAYSAERFAIGAEEFWQLGIRLINNLKAHAAMAAHPSRPSNAPLDTVLKICRNFHATAIELQSRHKNRPTLTINDEYDVQDLLRALLRQQFTDVRPEEAAPSCAGRSPRLDFLLKNERIVIETKMARDGLRGREIGDDLLQDIARYKGHPDCSCLVCFIYDPLGLIKNPHGLTADLEKQSAPPHFSVRALIAPSR